MNKKKSSKILNKCKNIKMVISDIDGVLTDGGMYYSEKGEILKKFNTRDGMAIELLTKNNIKTIFMTKENSNIVLKRAKKVKTSDVYIKAKNKELKIPRICKKFNILPKNIAYIGDDVNDLEIMKLVGFSATPKNGVDIIKKTCDYICTTKGGDGVLREVADMIISFKNC